VENGCVGVLVVVLVSAFLMMYLTVIFSDHQGFRYELKKVVVDHNHQYATESAHDMFASDADSEIEPHEFVSSLRSFSMEDEGDAAFKAADEDKDGRLSKQEFVAGIGHATKGAQQRMDEQFVSESQKNICRIGAYNPLYLEADGNDGVFGTVATVLNAVQFVVWLVSSVGFLVMCPVHTLYGVLVTVLIVVMLAAACLVCAVVFNSVRSLMGRPTPLLGGITVAGFVSAIAACSMVCVSVYLIVHFHSFLVPDGYAWEWQGNASHGYEL